MLWLAQMASLEWLGHLGNLPEGWMQWLGQTWQSVLHQLQHASRFLSSASGLVRPCHCLLEVYMYTIWTGALTRDAHVAF